MASSFGGMIQSVGASWLMTSIARSPEMVALVTASVTLPIMLLSLLAGAVADNFDRRRMMLAAQLFMLLVSVALAITVWAGLITPWLLLLFTFLIGCGAAFYGPAWQASVGEMVPRPALPGAVALNSMGFNIARSLGPAIGGAIVAAAGAATAFAVNAVSYLALLIVLARWSPATRERRLPRETLGVAMAAGVRYAALSPAIAKVLSRSLVFGFGASAISALMPLVARDLIAGGPLTYGLMLGAFGIGAVGGALASTRLRGAFSSEAIVRGSCLVFGGAAAAVGLSPWLVATLAALLAAGAAWVLALSTFNVTVQLNSPRWVVARALSLYQMAAFGGMAAGSWTWGMTAEDHGIPAALASASAVMLACALLGLRLPLPRTSDLNLDPLREWTPPAPAIDVRPRSGPVMVTIEFRISQEDIAEFLEAMAERRRVRRRDGARRWTLLRDLSDPEIWIERFHVANWIEYIRHNNRITYADALATGRARALHVGPEPPLVRRMIERQTGPLAAGSESLAEPLTDPRRFG
jgi:predicted MFS family arabinose efflux permease/quinol monooxygenase YgiN